MKCEVAQQDIALLVYGELPDDARHALENHLTGCEMCRGELEGVQALQRAMAISPVEEPSPNLLTRARMRLEEALDSMPNRGWMSKFTEMLLTGVSRVQAAPAVASGVLALGLLAGGLGGYRAGERAVTSPPQNAQTQTPEGTPDLAQVASIDGIVRQPGSEMVEVHYNRLVPEVLYGSLDSQDVRHLLMLGARSRSDNGIRANSVDLLAGECKAGHQCEDGPMRDALLVALQYDKSASVRLKALTGLQPYVEQDVKVRDAVLKAITSDHDPGVRMQAISLLTPAIEGDSSVRVVLHTAALEDTSPQIRTVSQQVLNQLPETQ